jgi:hypothetical protein
MLFFRFSRKPEKGDVFVLFNRFKFGMITGNENTGNLLGKRKGD